MSPADRADRLCGVLLGVALGDALGLPFEGLSARNVARRVGRLDRFGLVGRTGFVSDDTEQAALVAQALAQAGDDPVECRRLFRRSMVGWFARLPFGIGFGTLRACLRMMLGLSKPGVRSAGNGAAMRAGVVGAYLADEPAARRQVGFALASLTHSDVRAIEGAAFVAEVTANAFRDPPGDSPERLLERSREVLSAPPLLEAVDRALALARAGASLGDAARSLGNTGFIVHSLGLCTYVFATRGSCPMEALEAAIRAGGDTDTHAAIVGWWVGALHGAASLPASLIDELHDGPFGPSHLRALAASLADGVAPPRWSWSRALLRNLALYPVVLAHGLVRLAPW